MDKIISADKCPKCKTLLKLSLEPNTNCYIRRSRNKNKIKENIKYRKTSN
jgi:phage FluMu protein Com